MYSDIHFIKVFPVVQCLNHPKVSVPGAALRDLHSEGFGRGGVATGCVLFGRAAADGLQPLGGNWLGSQLGFRGTSAK